MCEPSEQPQGGIDPHGANLAVLAGRTDRDQRTFELSYGIFHGTAFCLAPDVFLTAAHVFKAAEGDGEVAVARLTPEQHHAQAVADSEIFGHLDLAVLRCPGLAAQILPFHFEPLPWLEDVCAFGFPFGFEPPVYYLRGFKGHVVTRRGLPPGPEGPAAYELSFVPPPGLSGAPLLAAPAPGAFAVVGMILRHHVAEFRDRRMELGLALDISELLPLNSRILGGTIGERVFPNASGHGLDRPT